MLIIKFDIFEDQKDSPFVCAYIVHKAEVPLTLCYADRECCHTVTEWF